MTAFSAVVPHADLQVASEAARGDLDAFANLYQTHLPRINSLAGWLLDGYPADVDDAVQEVFIRAWRKLNLYSGEAAFGTWLHRLAVHVILRIRRQSGRRASVEYPVDDLAAVGGGVAVRERPDLRVAIQNAVQFLPPSARDVFVLHDMEGHTHEEVGTLLGIEAGTSRSQLHRARKHLRRLLSSEEQCQ